MKKPKKKIHRGDKKSVDEIEQIKIAAFVDTSSHFPSTARISILRRNPRDGK